MGNVPIGSPYTFMIGRAGQSIAFRLWQIYLPNIVRQCGQLSSSHPGSAAHLMMGNGDSLSHLSGESQPKSATPLQPKNWNAHFWITFNFWWLAKAGPWTQTPTEMPKKAPLQPSKNEMLGFGLRSTSDDQPSDLVMDFNWNVPKGPSKSNKMKCSFLDYVHLLMIGRAGRWTRTPSATPLQQKK